MTHAEIIYTVKNLIEGGVSSDDDRLTKRQIAFIVSYYRAKLIKQDQDKGRLNIASYTQNIGSVELIQADKNGCCSGGECILRSKYQLPKPLETNRALNITFVGLVDGTPFTKTYHNAAYWSSAAKFTGKIPRWYWLDGYIYVISPPTLMLKTINIQGVFEDPVEAAKFDSCVCNNGGDCEGITRNFNYDYPMPLHHVDTLIKLIAQTELQILRSVLPDTLNNSRDEN